MTCTDGPHTVMRSVTAVAVLLAVVAGSTPAAEATATAPAAETPAEGDRLAFEYTFERLPDRPGFVRVAVETTTPAAVTSVAVRPPDDATVVDGSGYTRTDRGDDEWSWERSEGNDDPSLTYVANVNRTDDGTVEATDTGEWALFNWRRVDLSWRYDRTAEAPEPTVVERADGVVGEGVVGPGYAYLGPSRSEFRSVDGERIRVVVPEAAEPNAAPERIADALAAASDDLRVGARNDRLNVFVAPDPIDAAGRLSRMTVGGEQDLYVAADEPLETADNAWLHEYVHSRQAYRSGPDMVWFDDASAEYYAAVLAHEQGLVSRSAFYDHVRTNESDDAVLADAESVTDRASYTKGARVLAAADAQIRAGSDGARTLRSVLRSFNAHDGPVTRETFAEALSAAAGSDHGAWVDTYVTTSETPPVPASLPERSAFGILSERAVGVLLFGGGLLVGVGVTAYRSRW